MENSTEQGKYVEGGDEGRGVEVVVVVVLPCGHLTPINASLCSPSASGGGVETY